MKEQIYYRPDEAVGSDALHYKDCGLDYVYLLNGFRREEYDGDEYVSITDVDGLHRAIGLYIVRHRKAPSGKEIRFLRDEMDFSQAELGELLGVTDQSVARWEKGVCEAPGPAVLALRVIYILSLLPKEQQAEILSDFIEMTKQLTSSDETTDFAQFTYLGKEWQGSLNRSAA